MQAVANQPQAPTAIRTDLAAIFVSMELGRSTWLITSLSPGGGEKMAKHSARGGDVAGLLERFVQLQEKARVRMVQRFPIIVIQEAGLDGFWIDRVLQKEGIESRVADLASIAASRRRRRAKTDKIDGEAPVRGPLASKRGEPRAGAMVKAPTPEEDDRRRIRRERKAPIAERIRHVDRLKRLLLLPRHNRLRAATPRPAGAAGRAPDRRWPYAAGSSEGEGSPRARPAGIACARIKAVAAERDALLAAEYAATPAPAAMRLDLKGIPELAAILLAEGLPALRQPARSQLMQAWRRHPGGADLPIANKVSPKPAIRACARH